MRSITNLSAAPLRVPLPGGKTLHLKPNESGSIRDQAAEYPALQKLVEAGQLELGRSTAGSGGTASGPGRTHGDASAHATSGMRRKSGDR